MCKNWLWLGGRINLTDKKFKDVEELKLWLNRAYWIDKKITALKSIKLENREDTQSLTAGYNSDGGSCPSKDNGQEHRLQKMIDSNIDTDKLILQECEKIEPVKAEILDTIMLLQDEQLETILIYRYVNREEYESIAEKIRYSERNTYRKHKEAVEKLFEKLAVRVIECQ